MITVRTLLAVCAMLACAGSAAGRLRASEDVEDESGVSSQEPETPSIADDEPRQNVTTLEASIQQLSAPVNTDQLNTITFAIQELGDPDDQERLGQLLHQRVAALGGVSAQPGPALNTSSLAGTASLSDLQDRIETLNLGPAATVEDLRTRDQIVTDLAGLDDPVVREQLLRQLEQREHEADGHNASPNLPE